jgi:hypothetical protein
MGVVQDLAEPEAELVHRVLVAEALELDDDERRAVVPDEAEVVPRSIASGK